MSRRNRAYPPPLLLSSLLNGRYVLAVRAALVELGEVWEGRHLAVGGFGDFTKEVTLVSQLRKPVSSMAICES